MTTNIELIHACVGGSNDIPLMMCDVTGGAHGDIDVVTCPGCIAVLYECLPHDDCAAIGMGAGKRRWRPSNAIHGAPFIRDWCRTCAKDDGCYIRIVTMLCNVWDPMYPREWVLDGDGVECTAHEPKVLS